MARHRTVLEAFKALKVDIDAIPMNIAKEIKAKSEELTPVKSGFLKRSYSIEGVAKIGSTVRIINDAPYAEYVEYGSSKVQGRRMMTQALQGIDRDASKYA